MAGTDNAEIIDDANPPRVAFAHDWLVTLRGGERVLERLVDLLGPGPVYTLVASGRPLTDTLGRCPVVTSPLQRFPGATGRWRRAWLPLMPWAVERLRVEPCDLLVSTSSAVIKGIRPPQGTPHLCYCHSPPRYLWDRAGDYAIGSGGRLRRLGLAAAGRRLRRWDRATADRVTQFVANSRFTAGRIERCYGRSARIVPPPVRTDFFTPDAGGREAWLLVVAALEPYKRTDLVIEAANRAGLPLRVAGAGSQLATLRRLAGPTVEVLGPVSDDTLLELYRRAAALVFPQVEDFGITAVEAQATGCPVIALRAGGALETVTDETGVFIEERTPEAIIEGVERTRARAFDPEACRRSALRFAPEVFDAAMLEIVGEMLEPGRQ